ncbi:zinc finger matrin-type protein 3-like isoform X2 [Liolophura sinensis]|uniref:zinc finger matrin-type protein 3-like isoform X2 n=1 Tax=Liolophura sinensis TaxID=3198878 RepID=UPI00315955D8
MTLLISALIESTNVTIADGTTPVFTLDVYTTMFLHCAVCSLTVNSQRQYQQHLEGKAHLKRFKLSGGYASLDSLAHAITKQHPSPTAPPWSKQHVRDVNLCNPASNPLTCNLCQLTFSSQSQADDHYHGSRHAKRQRAAQQYSNVRISAGHEAGPHKTYCDVYSTFTGHTLGYTEYSAGTGNGTEEKPFLFVPPPSFPSLSSILVPALKAPPLPSETLTSRLVLLPHQPTANQSTSPMSWSAPAKRRSEPCFCTLCKAELTSHQQAEAHFRGGKHAKRVKTQMLNFELMSERGTAMTDVTKQGSTGFYCSFCEIHLNSLLQLDQHRRGGKHKQNLEKCETFRNTHKTKPSQLSDSYAVFACEMCCRAFSEKNSYLVHLKSLEHKNRKNELESQVSVGTVKK